MKSIERLKQIQEKKYNENEFETGLEEAGEFRGILLALEDIKEIKKDYSDFEYSNDSRLRLIREIENLLKQSEKFK